MALTITGKLIRSVETRHTAEIIDRDSWRVSWLPGRVLNQGQAQAAMCIAEAVGRIPADADPDAYTDDFWRQIDTWAGKIGLAGPDAVARASEPPAGD
jgi:hypothetical protein